jgi:acyl-coenzyme A thioesterase PaaI-like protein
MTATDPTLREQYCFGCGRHNPIGMHLVFERDDATGGVVTTYVPRREDTGFPNLMHGGLVTLLLDEAMGWAMYADHVFAVTAKIEVRYRRAVALEEPLVVRARIVRQRGRRIELEGRLAQLDGTALVEANALFLRMDRDAEASALASFRAGEGGEAWR